MATVINQKVVTTQLTIIHQGLSVEVNATDYASIMQAPCVWLIKNPINREGLLELLPYIENNEPAPRGGTYIGRLVFDDATDKWVIV